MQFRNIFKALAATYLASFALARDDCAELDDHTGLTYGIVLNRCEMNNNGEITALTLVNRNLRIPDEEIKRIFSTYNTITDLEYTIYGTSSYLRDYIVSDFYIDKLKNLEKFYFDFNSYSQSVRGEFQNYSPIDSKAFKKLNKIKEFSLAHIELSQDNIDEISKLTNLRKLDLIKCVYNRVNYDNLVNLTNLTSLKMENGDKENGLKEIPNFVFSSNLKEIIITGHQIVDIPDEFSNLKNLGNLNLSKNRIYSSIPESIQNLPKLKYANFIDNVNLYGKALTNPSLKNAKYDKDYDLCKPEDVEYLNKYSFRNCTPEDLTNQTNQCKDIFRFINNQNNIKNILNCRTNEKGEVTFLNIWNYSLNEEEVNKIISYDGITSLIYTINEYNYGSDIPEYDVFPLKITSLPNLSELKLVGARYFGELITTIPKNYLKKLKNITKLNLDTVILSQNNIDEIITLPKLKQLNIYMKKNEKLNLNKLNKLCKSIKCSINN